MKHSNSSHFDWESLEQHSWTARWRRHCNCNQPGKALHLSLVKHRGCASSYCRHAAPGSLGSKPAAPLCRLAIASRPPERRRRCAPAPAVQRRLVTLRTVLAAATRAVDYAGALLNYLVVGAAVFTGPCVVWCVVLCGGCWVGDGGWGAGAVLCGHAVVPGGAVRGDGCAAAGGAPCSHVH